MRDQPTGDQLLETARGMLREQLIPALPPDKRHAALMIANAMAIAARQLKLGDEGEQRELEALERMLQLPAANSDRRTALLERNRLLCQLIRQGRADEGALRDTLRAHLLRQARRRVEESNPKFLRGPA
jgi:hypothetical protein